MRVPWSFFTYGYNTWTKPVQVAAVGIAVKDDK